MLLSPANFAAPRLISGDATLATLLFDIAARTVVMYQGNPLDGKVLTRLSLFVVDRNGKGGFLWV